MLTQPGVLPAEPLYVDVSDNAPWDPDSRVVPGEASPTWPPRSTANPNPNWPAKICANNADSGDYAAPRSPDSRVLTVIARRGSGNRHHATTRSDAPATRSGPPATRSGAPTQPGRSATAGARSRRDIAGTGPAAGRAEPSTKLLAATRSRGRRSERHDRRCRCRRMTTAKIVNAGAGV